MAVNNDLFSYTRNEFICARFLKFIIKEFAAANYEAPELSFFFFILLIISITLNIFFSGKLEHYLLSSRYKCAIEYFQGVFILSAKFLYGFPFERLVLPHEQLSLVAPPA
jgi:hypothetical protein